VLASKKRLLLVPEISHLFLALKAEHEKSLTVEVISAYPLSAAEMDLFSTQLSKKHGQQVVLHNRIDTEIMGGAKIRVGDSVLDGSVKSKLVKLRQVLMSA
jgi:F-type H+-transporting ATPase subunit delta